LRPATISERSRPRILCPIETDIAIGERGPDLQRLPVLPTPRFRDQHPGCLVAAAQTCITRSIRFTADERIKWLSMAAWVRSRENYAAGDRALEPRGCAFPFWRAEASLRGFALRRQSTLWQNLGQALLFSSNQNSRARPMGLWLRRSASSPRKPILVAFIA